MPAVADINENSNKNVTVIPQQAAHSRAIIGVILEVSSKDSLVALKLRSKIEHEFGYEQTSLWDNMIELGVIKDDE